MPLTMRPTGLGHHVYKDNPTTVCFAASVASVGYTNNAPD
jgi:hypothetical protein